MLNRLLLLLSLTACATHLFAADPTPPATPAPAPALNERTPALCLTEALKVAQQYLEEKHLDVSAHFLSGVRYFDGVSKTGITSSKGPYWMITYEPKARVDGGQYFIHVYMNREAGHVGGL